MWSSGVGLGPLVPVKGASNASAYQNFLDNSMLLTFGKSLDWPPSSSNMTVHQCKVPKDLGDRCLVWIEFTGLT